MLIKEYRMVLPFTVEEYHIAQLYMVTKKTVDENKRLREEGHTEGLEVLKNEPFDDGTWQGQYTLKHYHLASQFPKWAQVVLPKSSLIMVEHSWNAYPYCKTTWSCPLFEKFLFTCESIHLPDRGETENALKVSEEVLKKRLIDTVDLVNDSYPVKKYVEELDPSKWQSKKFPERGKYTGDWMKTCEPHCCAYKLVTTEFRYWGLQTKVEALMHKLGMRDLVMEAHRELICWLDDWIDLKLEDIRKLEEEEAAAAKEFFKNSKVDEKQRAKFEAHSVVKGGVGAFGMSKLGADDVGAVGDDCGHVKEEKKEKEKEKEKEEKAEQLSEEKAVEETSKDESGDP